MRMVLAISLAFPRKLGQFIASYMLVLVLAQECLVRGKTKEIGESLMQYANFFILYIYIFFDFQRATGHSPLGSLRRNITFSLANNRLPRQIFRVPIGWVL